MMNRGGHARHARPPSDAGSSEPDSVAVLLGHIASERGMAFLKPGQIIRETYEVERFLAEGAFAEVYRVKHRFMGRQAMKVFKRTGMTREELDHMMSEAILLSRLAHPNIVQVFDANTLTGAGGEYGYFTMENVPGGSLDKFWRSHGARLVPLGATVDIVTQVCRGLVQAHGSDPPIIHRDIKPHNILIGYEGHGLRARISDFGLAKQVNKLTLLASAAGTLPFKPPEVFVDPKADSVAGDIWALGVTLYLLLTDTLPFTINGAVGWQQDVNAFHRAPPPPSANNIEVHSQLDEIVMRCLAFHPKDRYTNAKALLDDLTQCLSLMERRGGVLDETTTVSRASKDLLGTATSPNESQGNQMAERAVRLAGAGNLRDAADLMEEAFNKWPSLRQRYSSKVKLWRRGVIM